jgi:hypothetical protein
MPEALMRTLQGLAARLWTSARALLIMPLCDPYRPEWHYMRGPGPKSRAKQLASRNVIPGPERSDGTRNP